MKKQTGLLKNQDGMTMVEVLIGFVILSIIMGMLSGIIAFASNLYYESVDLRNAETKLSETVYKNSTKDTASSDNVTMHIQTMDGTNVDCNLSLCSVETDSLEGIGTDSSLDMTFFFIK